jgi:hypothetical protein
VTSKPEQWLRLRSARCKRLQGLFGRSFQLEVCSEVGEGTAVTMRIPLRKRSEIPLNRRWAITSEISELASN